MTVCRSCRHVNAEDAKFCLECAARELAEAEGGTALGRSVPSRPVERRLRRLGGAETPRSLG